MRKREKKKKKRKIREWWEKKKEREKKKRGEEGRMGDLLYLFFCYASDIIKNILPIVLF